jgi:hypothetical protein
VLFEIGKMAPRSPKPLPGVEYTGDLDSSVMNTPGSQLLDVFEQASEQVYKKNFIVTNRPGSQDSSMY